MPYGSVSELPASVRDKYSSKCQRAYMHAFNSVHGNTGDEGRAAAAGHSAAQKCEGSKDMTPQDLLKQLGIDLERDADDLEPITKAIDFEFVARNQDQKTGMRLKAYTEKDESGEDQHYLKGIASSTIKDRHGDTILPSALIDMERAANDNLTIFLNHDYKVPEDTGGSVVKASISSSITDTEGAPIYDLDFEKIRIDKANPRAIQTFKSIHGGTKLGLSIGARIPEGGAVRNKKTGALLIAHVELLETSIVGVPANPRSWVEYAMKAYQPVAVDGPGIVVDVTSSMLPPTQNATSGTIFLNHDYADLKPLGDAAELVLDALDDDPEPEVTAGEMSSEHRTGLPDSAFADPKNRKYPHHTSGGGVDKAHLANALARCAQKATTCSPAVKAHLEAHAKALGMGDRKSLEEPMIVVGEAGPEETIVLTTNPSQAAPTSEPGADGNTSPDVAAAAAAEPTPEPVDVTTAATPELIQALVDAQAALGEVTTKLIAAESGRAEAEQRALSAEQERDEVKKLTGDVLRDAAQIFRRLERLPVGQKASYSAIKADFNGTLDGLDGIYSEGFLKMLRQGESA